MSLVQYAQNLISDIISHLWLFYDMRQGPGTTITRILHLPQINLRTAGVFSTHDRSPSNCVPIVLIKKGRIGLNIDRHLGVRLIFIW